MGRQGAAACSGPWRSSSQSPSVGQAGGRGLIAHSRSWSPDVHHMPSSATSSRPTGGTSSNLGLGVPAWTCPSSLGSFPADPRLCAFAWAAPCSALTSPSCQLTPPRTSPSLGSLPPAFSPHSPTFSGRRFAAFGGGPVLLGHAPLRRGNLF